MPLATAQGQLQPTLAVSLSASNVSLAAGNETNVTGALQAGGPLQGTIAVSVDAPSGWTAVVTPTSQAVQAGGSLSVVVALKAPPAGQGAQKGGFDLKGTFTDASGRTASGTASGTVVRVDPVPPPVVPPDYRPLYAAIAVVLIAIVLMAVWLRSRALAKRRLAAIVARETGIEVVQSAPPHAYGLGREFLARVEVRNVSDRPRTAVLKVVSLPAGWSAAPSFETIDLAVGSRFEGSVFITPQDGAKPGDRGTVVVSAKPKEAEGSGSLLPLSVEVTPPRTTKDSPPRPHAYRTYGVPPLPPPGRPQPDSRERANELIRQIEVATSK
jgi:hypothetical protein